MKGMGISYGGIFEKGELRKKLVQTVPELRMHLQSRYITFFIYNICVMVHMWYDGDIQLLHMWHVFFSIWDVIKVLTYILHTQFSIWDVIKVLTYILHMQ